MPDRVLIVDDEENIRQMIRLTLEAAGYEVGEAEDGIEVLAILGGDPDWNVILLDQRLPGMEGTEVLRRIKVLAPTARVVMMTAFASVELAVEAMKLGARDFLRKPMTPELVRNSVAMALRKAADQSHEVQTETVTLNGFTILRGSSTPTTRQPQPNEWRFWVRTPDEQEQEVVIEISPEALASAQRLGGGTVIDNTFWMIQAEGFLRDFIWNDGHIPGGKLVLKGIDLDSINLAKRR